MRPAPGLRVMLAYTARPRQERNVIMKVSASVKRRCPKCKIIKRRGVVRVICVDPNHKQRQG